jgi:hypothetical protein
MSINDSHTGVSLHCNEFAYMVPKYRYNGVNYQTNLFKTQKYRESLILPHSYAPFHGVMVIQASAHRFTESEWDAPVGKDQESG